MSFLIFLGLVVIFFVGMNQQEKRRQQTLSTDRNPYDTFWGGVFDIGNKAGIGIGAIGLLFLVIIILGVLDIK